MQKKTVEVQELDARGLRCPLPLLKLRQALRHLPEGTLLRVLSSDAGSAQDIPRWLAESHHQLLEVTVNGECSEFLVRAGGTLPTLPARDPSP